MFRTFGDAKDRWKIDGRTMKCFYLHSESGYLYCWDQPTGILYEYGQATGQCQAVWSSAVPELNAELWTVLPLPPTDPASLQMAIAQSGNLPNVDVFLILTVAHEAGAQVPADVIEAAGDEFCSRSELEPQARARLRELPPAGQGFAIQNFRAGGSSDPTKEFLDYVGAVMRKKPPPWGGSACTLRVEVTGAILGRCCADLDALCRGDPVERLAQAHCKIMSEQDRFFVCDLNSSEEGTTLDGFDVSTTWVGPLKSGSLLIIGPLRIRIQLSDMAQDAPLVLPPGAGAPGRPLEAGCSDSDGEAPGESSEWRRKVYRKTDDDKLRVRDQEFKRQEQYKDRAEIRRQKSGGLCAGGAFDGLIGKFEVIRQQEKAAEEAEEARVEQPTQSDHREGNMSTDGSFVGFGGLERAGIGYNAAMGELIPDVLDPRGLSQQDAARMKAQMRFQQAS